MAFGAKIFLSISSLVFLIFISVNSANAVTTCPVGADFIKAGSLARGKTGEIQQIDGD